MGTGTLLLAVFLFVLWVVIWAIGLIGWRVAYLRHAHPTLPSRLATLPRSSAPGVTIIRPICGLDDNLFNALDASMRQEYPKYQVIFALQDEKDEALPVVRMVMERYPDVDARVVINDLKIGVNPKINNLISPVSLAKYDLLWVIDSTISVVPGTLARAVDAFLGTNYASDLTQNPVASFESDLESTPLLADDVRAPPTAGDVGLVHHVPFAVVHQKSLGSLVEMAFLNSTHAKMYLAINAVAIDSCVMGKSNLYSRHNISSLSTPAPSLQHLSNPPTGLAAFSPFLAEDNMIALSLWHELHLKHAMTSDVAFDFLGRLSLSDYIARRVRWIRVRKRMTPIIATVAEPFTESIVSGLCGAWAMNQLFRANGWGVFVVHMLIWVNVDLSVRRSLGWNRRNGGGGRGKAKGSASVGTGMGSGGAGADGGAGASGVSGENGSPDGVSTLVFIAAWTVREILALPVFLYGILGDEVWWRGKRYRVVRSGEAVCVE